MCNTFKKSAALENVNLYLLNKKLNAYISKNALQADEERCRMVKMTLRHHIHHFPVNVPIIAAVKRCKDGKIVVFNIKKTKLAIIDGHSIASETPVAKEFVIDGIRYVETMPCDGFQRYQPLFKRNRRDRIEMISDIDEAQAVTPHTLHTV